MVDFQNKNTINILRDTIKAKARDTFGLESDWSEFEVGMQKKQDNK